jgi:hypothetical protein
VKVGRSYTNKDLKDDPPLDFVSSSTTITTPTDVLSVDETKTDTNTEETWRQRMGLLRDQFERDTVIADALQSRINALTTDFVNRDDPAQRAVIEADRIRARAELDRTRMAIDADVTAIQALEEEARRAGVPAGWLR